MVISVAEITLACICVPAGISALPPFIKMGRMHNRVPMIETMSLSIAARLFFTLLWLFLKILYDSFKHHGSRNFAVCGFGDNE